VHILKSYLNPDSMQASMFERTATAKPFPLQLRLGGGLRILAPRGEAILGWLGGGSAGAAQPLTVPGKLLAPCPTSGIVYACNLPAGGIGPDAVPDVSCQLPDEIGRDLEDSFLAASLPGGQTAAVTLEGDEVAMQFRWICLTSHVSIGAVWRCFVRMGRRGAGAWRAIEHDYIFDAGGGVLLNPPGSVAIPGAGEFVAHVMLEHPEGMMTSFPCSLGRVKVTRLARDGWPRRHVLGIMMQDDSRIVAFFSDGRQEMIATAAPSSRRAARAAA
jgi:hypothetical protein